MNHNHFHRLLIAVLLLGLMSSSYAQLSNDSLDLVFSSSEINKLSKGDKQINKGIALYPQINTLLSTYQGSQSSTPRTHLDDDKIQSSLRSCRPYYTGVFLKTNVYLKRLQRLKKELQFTNDIDKLLAQTEQEVKKSKKEMRQSRNSRHLQDAMMHSANAINIHRQIQTSLYTDILELLNRTPEEEVEETLPPVETVEVIPTDTVPAIEEIVEEKPEEVIVPVVEVTEPVKQPEVYFSIQIIADKAPVVETRLKQVYNGSRSIIMNEGDGWYRYSVGKFNSYDQANSIMKSEGIKGFVVAYSNGKRITTAQAKTILNSK
ncbi:SPOR domain-containing protein [Carboxylicivirga linearis]|uniref:SPOR domain-containing protein n=1 Tax=Carboxylicivirga linearis TaxID=1628157 RepID=A0ABS5JZH7_9BACT|nr:SPOR domain-containing protein [Carboxylicivirga linearis]MBS2100205.1 SPOR domain-containing protein [Carboxylicivirga linearis]